jgi:hypothetical protein
MQFLKRHFEKIILSAVLAGLGVAAFWLSVAVKEATDETKTKLKQPSKTKSWEPVNLAVLRDGLMSLTNPPAFSLSGDHNLFNPVTWKVRRNEGFPFKATITGPTALVVTDIRPLYFTLSLESRQGEDGFNLIAKHDWHDVGPTLRWFARVGEKATVRKPYPIVGTNGAPDNPAMLILQVKIPETDEVVAVSSNAPYKAVEGYEADLDYKASDMTNQFLRKHVDNLLYLSWEPYKIIAIASNTVRVQNTNTLQNTEREWKGGH